MRGLAATDSLVAVQAAVQPHHRGLAAALPLPRRRRHRQLGWAGRVRERRSRRTTSAEVVRRRARRASREAREPGWVSAGVAGACRGCSNMRGQPCTGAGQAAARITGNTAEAIAADQTRIDDRCSCCGRCGRASTSDAPPDMHATASGITRQGGEKRRGLAVDTHRQTDRDLS